MRLGIMGGTFDPIHYGHLFVAEESRVRFQLSSVMFIPNGLPPHKQGCEVTPPEDRYAMTEIATASNPYFECSRIELVRSGPSYTIDTLEWLERERPDADLVMITGIDAIAEILTWRRHQEVIQRTTFIAATRPGFDIQYLKDRLPTDYLSRIATIGSTSLGISSTDIRARVQAGSPIRYLTPDGVAEYIKEHRLYLSDGSDMSNPSDVGDPPSAIAASHAVAAGRGQKERTEL
jgi:nicotinate-nucleotide adenylyltransferase